MAYFRCNPPTQSPIQNIEGFAYIDNSNNLHFADLSEIQTNNIYVCYRRINLSTVSWSYYSNLSSPCFAFTRPNDVPQNSAGFILDGYTSEWNFWNAINKNKYVASGLSNINVSNFDFDESTINDFAEFMSNKVIYAPLSAMTLKQL